MPQRTRMFRVWTGLAASMTAGAVLLSWLEQGAPVAAAPPSSAALAASAQHAVADCYRDLRSWSGIVLVGMVAGPDRSALIATRPQDDVHFLLYSTGDLMVQPSWREQRAVDAGGTIRVGLVAASPAAVGNRTQVRALRALISTLNASLPTEEGAPLRIVGDAGRADQAMMDAIVRQLRELLAADEA